jgi:hypothetical protein
VQPGVNVLSPIAALKELNIIIPEKLLFINFADWLSFVPENYIKPFQGFKSVGCLYPRLHRGLFIFSHFVA